MSLLEVAEGLTFTEERAKALILAALACEEEFVVQRKLNFLRGVLHSVAQIFPKETDNISVILTRNVALAQKAKTNKAGTKFIDHSIKGATTNSGGCDTCGDDARPEEGPKLSAADTIDKLEAYFSFKKNDVDALRDAKKFAKSNGVTISGNIGLTKLCEKILKHIKEVETILV